MFFAAATRAPSYCIPPPIDEGWKLHLMNTAKVPLRQPLHAAKKCIFGYSISHS